ncbi:cobalt ECF transporter T component CbiQ [Candidatus Bathyarchaeota archaeon]|nr:cobalt ECF transporter T component CbiQ [Candidatus Bathyarchaeota archaeon]
MIAEFLNFFRETLFVEKYSSINGFLQKIDPRAKFISFTALILASITLSSPISLLLFLMLTFLLAFASKISIKEFLFKTLFFITFFSILIALPSLFITPGVAIASFNIFSFKLQITFEGFLFALQFIFRVWTCVSSLILLNLTSKFSSIINAMESFKIPKVFTMMVSITYRFLFLFVDEAYKMVLAKEAREAKKMSKINAMKTLGFMLSSLFIRAFEKGERVYLAMKNRGYSGEIKNLNVIKFHFKDAFFIFFFFIFIIFAFLSRGFFNL